MQTKVGTPDMNQTTDAFVSAGNSPVPWLERLIRQHNLYVHGLLGFLALCSLLAYYLPPLVRTDVYNNDMNEHVAWYHAAKNPALFHDDLMKDYFTSLCPLGYKAVFSTFCTRLDPRTLGAALSLLLGIAGVFLAYQVGEAATSGSAIGGITAVLLLLLGHAFGLGPFIKVFQGGLQRAFALPLFLLGVWAVLRDRMWALGVALVLAALFFPPVCIVMMVFSAGVTGWAGLKSGRFASLFRKKTLILAGVYLVCASLLLLTKAVAASHGHWTVYSFKDAVKMPEFHEGGIWEVTCAYPILFPKWSDYITCGLGIPHPGLLAATMIFFFWRVRKHRDLIMLLVLSAVGTWGLAYLVLFNLYEPTRYISYSLQALWFLLLPGIVLEVTRSLDPGIKPPLERLNPMFLRHKTGWAIGFIVLVTGVTVWVTWSRILHGEGGMKGTASTEVYQFLQTLPETTKIAADPVDADDIPMRSQRSVLASSKAMWPYHKEFYEQMKARIVATWTALYATNCEDILPLKRRYGADVLLVNEVWYHHDSLRAKPFDTILASLHQQLHGATPLVLRLPREAVLFQSGSFSVVDLNVLDRLNSSPRLAEAPPAGP
jgi:hypothetical protein